MIDGAGHDSSYDTIVRLPGGRKPRVRIAYLTCRPRLEQRGAGKNSGTAISGNFTPSINCRSVSTEESTFREGILDRPFDVADGVQRQPGPVPRAHFSSEHPLSFSTIASIRGATAGGRRSRIWRTSSVSSISRQCEHHSVCEPTMPSNAGGLV